MATMTKEQLFNKKSFYHCLNFLKSKGIEFQIFTALFLIESRNFEDLMSFHVIVKITCLRASCD